MWTVLKLTIFFKLNALSFIRMTMHFDQWVIGHDRPYWINQFHTNQRSIWLKSVQFNPRVISRAVHFRSDSFNPSQNNSRFDGDSANQTSSVLANESNDSYLLTFPKNSCKKFCLIGFLSLTVTCTAIFFGGKHDLFVPIVGIVPQNQYVTKMALKKQLIVISVTWNIPLIFIWTIESYNHSLPEFDHSHMHHIWVQS